ncbi:MAG: glycosyl hydrolase 53 family protein [Paludibacter sp.]
MNIKYLIIILIQCSSVLQPVFSNVNNPSVTTFAAGADVGWLTEMEASNKKFYTADGTQMECMALLKSLGMNSIRLRVWVNPTAGWCNAADLLVKAKRANNLGMRIMVDFHYSDWWADPGQQNKPAAWTTLSLADLKIAVGNHTREVLNLLKSNNITPEWVQVGNETGNGMLWETGKASVSMANYAALNNAGYDAVKEVFPTAKVIVHLHNGYDNGLFRWIFDGLKTNGGKYDVIGMSLYPSWYTTPDDWQKANKACLANMNDMVARYNKEVMVVECGMSWDKAATAKQFLTDIIAKTKLVTGGKGTGVFYWEPQCYGNWQGYSLGAFDNSGKPTVAMDAFKNATNLQPNTYSKLEYKIDTLTKKVIFNKQLKSIEIYDVKGALIKIIQNNNSIALNQLCKGINILKIIDFEQNRLNTIKITNN